MLDLLWFSLENKRSSWFCLLAYMKSKVSSWFAQHTCCWISSSLLPRGDCFKPLISKSRFQCLAQLSWSGYFYKEIPLHMFRFQARWRRAWPAAWSSYFPKENPLQIFDFQDEYLWRKNIKILEENISLYIYRRFRKKNKYFLKEFYTFSSKRLKTLRKTNKSSGFPKKNQ